MPPDQLINSLVTEIKRTCATDPDFLVGYLKGMLSDAINVSPKAREQLSKHLGHLQTLPDA
jgi:hypothetical protein